MPSSAVSAAYARDFTGVPGWFSAMDFEVFDWILADQDQQGVAGDLLEVGAFLGKSAVLIGLHQGDGQRFVVCDLFGSEAPDPENEQENLRTYKGLNRLSFEANYKRHTGREPEVLHASSAAVVGYIAAESLRFLHIDGSHLYDVVRDDLAASKSLLGPHGVVVCDDFRRPHTPGVAAAVWGAVASEGLIPLCLTEDKFYGAWTQQAAMAERMRQWLGRQDMFAFEEQTIASHKVVRVFGKPSRVKARLASVIPSSLLHRLRGV